MAEAFSQKRELSWSLCILSQTATLHHYFPDKDWLALYQPWVQRAGSPLQEALRSSWSPPSNTFMTVHILSCQHRLDELLWPPHPHSGWLVKVFKTDGRKWFVVDLRLGPEISRTCKCFIRRMFRLFLIFLNRINRLCSKQTWWITTICLFLLINQWKTDSKQFW